MSLRSYNSGVGTVPLPAGLVNGDYLVMIVHGGRPVLSGWTKTDLFTGLGTNSAAYLKVASSESAVNLGSLDYGGNIFAFTGETSIEATGVPISPSFGTSITAPSVTSLGVTDRYLLSGYSTQSSWNITVPGSQQSAGQVFMNDSFAVKAVVGYETISASGATGTRVATAAGMGSAIGVSVLLLSVTPVPVNTVSPSCSPSSGSTATSFVFSSGTWSNSPTSWAWEYRAQGSSGSWTQFSTSQNPTVAGGAFGAGVWDTRLTATNAGGSSTPASGTQITVASPVPVNTVAPAVTPAIGVVGATFTSTAGTWTNAPTSYAYQWKLDGINVGTNASTYAPVAAGSLTCVVTASNAGGSGTATSNAATVVSQAASSSSLGFFGL